MGSYAFVNTIIRGAGGEGDQVAVPTIGINTGGGFNASSEQVRTLAIDIYNGFAYLAESTEVFKNIQIDASKTSLNPIFLPSKPDVLSFLVSVQVKINSMQARGRPFSTANNEMNDISRRIEFKIDQIKNLNTIVYARIRNGNINYCNDSADECKEDNYIRYTGGLFEAWTPIREDFMASENPPNQDFDLNKIIQLIAEDYKEDLYEIFGRLENIYEDVKNIEAISQGSASQHYNRMKGAYGYDNIYLASVGNEYDYRADIADGENFLRLIKDWELGNLAENPIDIANQYMVVGLEAQSDLYNELKKLQFVEARLTADVVEGNAPLTVIFDALASDDPAGGSLEGNNILCNFLQLDWS